METDDEILDAMEKYGLFIAKLNNGDWMAGRATYIYHIDITQDHYADPNLSISASLSEAVANAVEKLDEIKKLEGERGNAQDC
ncbi:hypothetical protein ES703_87648 [subsurface metagenome]